MGKGLDTCLVVKQITKGSVAQLDVDIAEKKQKLLQLTSLNVQAQPREGLARQVTAVHAWCLRELFVFGRLPAYCWHAWHRRQLQTSRNRYQAWWRFRTTSHFQCSTCCQKCYSTHQKSSCCHRT